MTWIEAPGRSRKIILPFESRNVIGPCNEAPAPTLRSGGTFALTPVTAKLAAKKAMKVYFRGKYMEGLVLGVRSALRERRR
jgi:hypothetical protein